MAKSAIKLTVKTPIKTYKVEDYKTQNHIFYEEVENNVARVTLNKLSEAIETANNQTLSIIATFFQRVVSRTPLDEDYLLYTTEEGKEVWHRADKNQCRYDWLIDIDGKQVTSGDIKDALGEDVFMQVNNQDCINKIKEYIKNFFGEEADYSIAEIWNVNPHFDVLEYGGYHNQKNDDGTWNDNNWAKKQNQKLVNLMD